MYLAIIVLPLLGSISSGFFGRKLGISGSHFITTSLMLLTVFLAIIAFIEVGFNNISVTLDLFNWIDSEYLNILWGFNFDSLTVSMLIPVLIVSSLVHLYSIEYMGSDPHNQRFFSYLSLFTFMMIILVTANNYLLMFVGWEGVGVCSYLLVNFWYTRVAANQSSVSAFLTNRVGDCLLTIGMFIILWSFGNLDFSTIFSISPYINQDIITIIGICLLIGAMAKSSQIGLHVWLPLAMEGPTPVSALIHAATMVTAGVYLLIRTSPLLEYSSTTLILCLWIGAITTIFSSLIGLFQQDIKKVIAYSTMSQLGMMVIAIGLSTYNVALFHLINHAFYKALLFLGAGAVIHAVYDNQDFRRYGAFKQFLPLTYSVMLIASLSLIAFPFMTGFYSKDLIIESSLGQFYLSSIIVYFIAVVGAMFTTLYSIKILYLTFLTNPNGPILYYKNIHENGTYINIPLVFLAIFSIFFGYVFKDIFIGLGSGFFEDNSVYIHPLHESLIDTEFASITIFKLIPFISIIVLIVLSSIILEYTNRLLIFFKFNKLGYNIYSLFNQRLFIELFYNNYIASNILKLGGQTSKILDKGSIELIGPYGLEKIIAFTSKILNTLNSGVITTYALYILIGSTFIMIMPLHIFDIYCVLLIVLAIFINIYYSNRYSYSLRISKNSFLFFIIKKNKRNTTYNIYLISSFGNKRMINGLARAERTRPHGCFFLQHVIPNLYNIAVSDDNPFMDNYQHIKGERTLRRPFNLNTIEFGVYNGNLLRCTFAEGHDFIVIIKMEVLAMNEVFGPNKNTDRYYGDDLEYNEENAGSFHLKTNDELNELKSRFVNELFSIRGGITGYKRRNLYYWIASYEELPDSYPGRLTHRYIRVYILRYRIALIDNILHYRYAQVARDLIYTAQRREEAISRLFGNNLDVDINSKLLQDKLMTDDQYKISSEAFIKHNTKVAASYNEAWRMIHLLRRLKADQRNHRNLPYPIPEYV